MHIHPKLVYTVLEHSFGKLKLQMAPPVQYLSSVCKAPCSAIFLNQHHVLGCEFSIALKEKVLPELTLAPLLRSVCILLIRTFSKCIVLLVI